MGNSDKELLQKLLATFKIEAEEHIQALSSGLIELEKASSLEQQVEIVETVFREAHSLKGAARAVNLVAVEGTCQSLENSFAQLKFGEIAVSKELLDHLHQTVDALKATLSSGNASTSTPATAKFGPAVPENIASPPMRDEKPGLSETLRVPTAKLDSLLRQAEELIPLKATAAQRAIELREISQTLAIWEAEWRKVKPHAHAMSAPGANLAESENGKISVFFDRTETILRSVQNKVAAAVKRLDNDRRILERRVDELLEDTKRMSMVPFSALLESFPKLVRDLCRDCNKDAELRITGGEIETDRRILEEIKDPLIHLVRNSIDHGIETAKRRQEKGKPPRATIHLAISPKSADKVEIVVSDDGGGIDLTRVQTAAVKLGLLSREEAANTDEQQLASLIFKSGISTSPIITEVSGRGLGLAIVREKVEKVGGTVSLETTPGTGTTFRLILPLTLARFRGVLVRVGDSLFVLPSRYVQRVLRIKAGEIKSAENRETIQIEGRAVSAVRLNDVLEITQKNTGPAAEDKMTMLVLGWAGEQIGFIVDEILDEQEVLVKGLGKQLRRVRNIAGTTVLGTGKVLPVLNVADLMQSAVSTARGVARHDTGESPQSILVAEDSITSRTLLKNILELAGYKVKTTVDGFEAFSTLAQESFDLVVSDVEMPRMNGFDLTAKIRADKRLAELPVVLVTGLESREHRERGVDVGANAYIVKSNFDQGNLLEVVRRLI